MELWRFLFATEAPNSWFIDALPELAWKAKVARAPGTW
jgi:hypothetical protein